VLEPRGRGGTDTNFGLHYGLIPAGLHRNRREYDQSGHESHGAAPTETLARANAGTELRHSLA